MVHVVLIAPITMAWGSSRVILRFFHYSCGFNVGLFGELPPIEKLDYVLLLWTYIPSRFYHFPYWS